MRSGLRWGLMLFVLLATAVGAQEVPAPLQGWQDWVLHDHKQHACPFLAGSLPDANTRRCLWPGRLALRLNETGGHFDVQVDVDGPAWLPLPGNNRHWPQQVEDNGRTIAVHDQGGTPMVYLQPGRHVLSGRWSWTAKPSRLVLPEIYGLLDVFVAGALSHDFVRADGALSFGRAAPVAHASNSLSVEVFRHLADGRPPILATQLQLDVSGKAREVVLGPVLPEGYVATRLRSTLPARLDDTGLLHVQVRPGRWQVSFRARGTQVLDGKQGFVLPTSHWPSREIWSYADAPSWRHTRATGQAVDPAQVGVPSYWRQLPAFVVDNDRGVTVTAGARAGEGGAGPQVFLRRELWLSFDGNTFIASDGLGGSLSHPRRLEVAPPWQLQRASDHGRALLVGLDKNGRSGIEVRNAALAIQAGLAVPRKAFGRLPVNGWQLPLERIDTTLHLPPGYHLVAAPGVGSSGSWLARWDLLDLFFAALIALMCLRLVGWRLALVAVVYLALAHDQPYAPWLTLLVALGLALLHKALPAGRLQQVARLGAGVFAVIALLWALPFMAGQLRSAVYPQLEQGMRSGQVATVQFVPPPRRDRVHVARDAEVKRRAEASSDKAQAVGEPIPMATPAPPPAPPAPSAPPAPPPKVLKSTTVSGSVAAPLEARPGPVQSGPGIPDWQVGNSYALHWVDPVTPDQHVRLLIASAWLVSLLRVLAVLALAWLLARLVQRILPPGWRRLPQPVGAAAVVVLLLAGGLAPGLAQADELPSPALLQQLQQRLLEPPPCGRQCATLAAAQVRVDGDALHVSLQAMAEAAVAVPLPQAGEGMRLRAASIDGRPAPVHGSDNSSGWLRLERGVHALELVWRVSGDDLRLGFGQLAPKTIAVNAPGWLVNGITDGRLSGDSLQLSRQQQENTADVAAKATTQSFAPWVRLTRRLEIGSDWRVTNIVERVSPAEDGFSVALPLLPGEHPLGNDAEVADGKITVSFRAGQDQVTWRSRIEPFQTLELVAPPLSERAESWQLQTASSWHVAASGVPTEPANRMRRWSPLPGERLELAIHAPEAAPGAMVAADRVSLDVWPGERSTRSELELALRSTHGGQQAISLPKNMELVSATRDGNDLALAPHEGKLRLPLRVGSHDYDLVLQQAVGAGLVMRTPALDLAAPAANIGINMHLPDNRWLLWTWGPDNGPAVLLWSQLLVLLLVAWVLARWAPTPLRWYHWLLLGLGFSTFAWTAFALVAAWLIVLGLRARLDGGTMVSRGLFNLMQIGLGLFTLAALLVLVAAVPAGLLGQPDMHVAGVVGDPVGGARHLHWLLDRSQGMLPQAGALSLPLWCYKLAILAWALWLANALIGWLRWGFGAWSRGGYWRAAPPKAKADDDSEPADA